MKYYRCENEWGKDPCEFAQSNRKISSDELSPAMDGSNPKCSGKTQSDSICGHELVFVGEQGNSTARIAIMIGGIIALLLVVFVIYRLLEPPVKEAPQVNETVKRPQDPWQVYQELERSSTILRREQK